MAKNQDDEENKTSSEVTDDIDQPDYSLDSQVEGSFVDASADALTQSTMQNSIENAQFNFNNPVMPADEMAKLEKSHPGAIDRILSMGELEQVFTHQLQEKIQGEHTKLNDRNIEMSKEQTLLINKKIDRTVLLIILMVVCAVGLFSYDKNLGGALMIALSAAVAIIFVLGKSPDALFSIFRMGSSKPPEE